MLSNFIRWNSKRKETKVNDGRSRPQTFLPPLSPMVFNIEEECTSPSEPPSPRSVDIDISLSNESWSPQELLRSRSYSPGFSLGSCQRTKGNAMQLTRTDTSPTPPSRRSQGTFPRTAARKKSIPAPILIPDVELHIPNIKIGRSPPPAAVPAPEMIQPNASDAPMNPHSPSPSDNRSSILDPTLAHAMIASTFVLTLSDRHASRHRSGTVRQDSATLPRRESCLVSNSARSSLIPPMPPVPAMIVGRPPSQIRLPSIQSGASTESEYPMSDAYITSPETAISSEISGQISRTPEAPSQTASASSDALPPVVPNATLEDQTSLGPGCPRGFKNNAFDGPITVVDIPLPLNVQGTTLRSSPEGSFGVSSEDHSLDEFDFVPPGLLVAVGSPASDSSASYTMPLPRRRSDAKRRCRFAGSNFVRNGFKDQLEGIASHPYPSIPSATTSEHDYGELFNCELTISPGSSSSSQFVSSGSAGYQTFPETPLGFSPLWSPLYALLAKNDSQALRRRPPTPAGLGPRMLYSSMKSARLQIEGGVMRRSRSPLLPRQKAPSPRQPRSSLSASVHANDMQGISEDPCQGLRTVEAESYNAEVIEAAVRPHPLVHMSTSSSSLPEEEAPRALARRSFPSLPSVSVEDVGALPNPLPVPAPVVDPASIPLPESTEGSPFNSPASAGNVMAITSPTSSLHSPLPSSTSTVVSQASCSKSPLSGSSLFHGESFLPSPPPAPLSAPLPRTLSPIPFASSPVASDDSISAPLFPPPPYHTVVSERTAYHTSSSPSTSPTSSSDLDYRHVDFRISGTVRSRGRARPPLPIGPRKPSAPGQVFGSYGSVSSASSSDSGAPWNKLRSAASKPPPKFQMPPPKWRGLTLEAARWTFTSAQLQEVVSRALQQSSEGSSIRLLRLEVLEGEMADEMNRLELQHTDVKTQYRTLVRKRWALLGALASRMEVGETIEAAHTMEALVEVLSELDQLADRMHDIVLNMSQLRSLHDVHKASALALAVRKINGVFVRQMAEKERLQEHMGAVKTERDEAWKHAEDIAKEYDTLNDHVWETTVRRALTLDNILPPLPRLSVNLSDGPLPTSISLGSAYSCQAGTAEALALAEAQREVYEMLGLSPPCQTSSPVNCRRLSMPDNMWRPPRRRPRPASESLLARTRPRPDRARATKSVVFEDRLALTVK